MPGMELSDVGRPGRVEDSLRHHAIAGVGEMIGRVQLEAIAGNQQRIRIGSHKRFLSRAHSGIDREVEHPDLNYEQLRIAVGLSDTRHQVSQIVQIVRIVSVAFPLPPGKRLNRLLQQRQ